MKSRGLGDTVGKVTAATGVKRLVRVATKAVGIEDCGCSARQEKLNDPKLLVNKVFYKTTNN